MVVEHEIELHASPHRVLAELTHPDFLHAYAADLGARLEGVETAGEDGARRTALRLGVPTRGIPPAFSRFVGGAVTVVDTRTWRADGEGATADVEVRARIFGRAAVVRGRRALAPAGAGTCATATARVSVDAPVVGRQAEAAVSELVLVVLRREAALLHRRLRLPPV